ncbi:MAG: tRNA glutamyl-Q(34) synthetase GluQRS [Candidatus Sericytochromatia bacterium]|nr:tRNA glutamyl-Q(34) synthetase GluQRS [Candidatus Sericytochromatia bacterium]
MPEPVVGRLAPSPTGCMHLGNARTALLAWLLCRASRGRLILRLEDLDTQRVRDFAYDAIRRDLVWLGLDWDAEYLQSDRLEIYTAYLSQLDTYPCYCTRKEIQAVASAPHGQELVYPGTCRLHPPRSERAPAWRWRVPAQTLQVQDLRLGQLVQHLPSDVGDFVLQRNDGCFAYHFAVVVDDGLMGVNQVVRGEDLWSATPRQVALQQALGFQRPMYCHVPLMRDFRGQRLAKREGAPPLAALREAGEKPGRVLAELACSLGWTVPAEISAQELLTHYGMRLPAALSRTAPSI